MSNIIAGLYEIIRPLGSGGRGVVYLGRHLRLEKDVVLKADKRMLSEKIFKSLRREVDALKNLSHTYIPQVYDFVAEGEIVYTVMEYIDGESLDMLLKSGKQFTSLQVVRWAKQLLEALVYLHSRPPHGILHSDIKPANIMLSPQGDICLIDFNIALTLGEEGAISVGRSQGYASPEHYGLEYSTGNTTFKNIRQSTSKITTMVEAETIVPSDDDIYQSVSGIAEKQSVTPVSTGGTKKTIVLDARSDIYGVGATLYHLLTGRKPARNAADVIPISEDDCPPGLASIINKAMSLDKNLRFQTATEILAAFENIHKNDPRAKLFRRIRNISAAFLATTLAVGLFTAYTGLRRMESEKNMIANAEISQNALTRGNISEALKWALISVPTSQNDALGDFFTPPTPANAQKALMDALGVYDLSDGFKPHQTLSIPSAPLMADLSPNGKTAAVVYAFEVAVTNLESGEVFATFQTEPSALAEARFLDDKTLVYAGLGGLCAVDLPSRSERWRGQPATAVCVSADGKTIASINRDEDFAVVYGTDGSIRSTINFNGKKQRIPSDDTFANPRENLFALSGDGRFLAVSFADGSLTIFDTLDASNNWEILDVSDLVCFEGGFSGDVLAFSATSHESSGFAIVDAAKQEPVDNSFGLPAPLRIRVTGNETGIFYSFANFINQFDPVAGEEWALSNSQENNIYSFAVCDEYMLASMNDGGHAFFDTDGRLISKYKRGYRSDITLISKDFALIGGRNETDMTIFKLNQIRSEKGFSYDSNYVHDEARISMDETRVMLFSVDGFRLYDEAGTLVLDQKIPDRNKIHDQQYSKQSGNLAVIYKDALKIYSGQDGTLFFDEKDLSSVFYAPYGISVLDGNGLLRLIDIDSGKTLFKEQLNEDEPFAAYCGTIVTSAFLDGRKLIGSAEIKGDYWFAVSDGAVCTVYNLNGNERFTVLSSGDCEAFFLPDAIVISPLHGTPSAYRLENGKKICDLQSDSYLTYIQPIDDYIASQYISTDNEIFGVLLNSDFQPIASLPRLCDISGTHLVFDYPQGVLRQSRVYSIDELIALAKARQALREADV